MTPVALQFAAMIRSTHFLVLIVVLVALFGAFHLVLDAAGLCGSGGCPETMESSGGHAGFSLACVAVAAAVSGLAVFAFSVFVGRWPATSARPYKLYLSPDSPPPR